MRNLKTVYLIVFVYIFIYILYVLYPVKAGFNRKFVSAYLNFGDTEDYIEYIDNTLGSLNNISPDFFTIDDNGNLKLTNKYDENFVKEAKKRGLTVTPSISNYWDRVLALKAVSNRDSLSAQIAEAVSKYNFDGISVNIDNLRSEDRDFLSDLIGLIRNRLEAGKILSAYVAANPGNIDQGWIGSYDYSILSKFCDYLVILSIDEHYNGSSEGAVSGISYFEESIKYAVSKIPKEKIVMAIPMYGRYWKTGVQNRNNGLEIASSDIADLKAKFKGVITYDYHSESPKLEITIPKGSKATIFNGTVLSEGSYTIWYENEKSIRKKLEVINTYGVKGAENWSLGEEIQSIWNFYEEALNETNKTNDNYVDIKNHWAYEEISLLINRGLIRGIDSIHFEPERTLTRAETAAIIVRALGLDKQSGNYFPDTKTHWAKDEISTVKYYGLMQGNPDKTFEPDRQITREEIAGLLDRITFFSNYRDTIVYTDVQPTRWSYTSIIKLSSNNLLFGYSDGTFRPEDGMTRAEIAVLLNRMTDVPVLIDGQITAFLK